NLAEQLSYKFTVSGETVKPYVVSTYPNYGAIGIPKSTNIIITFSEPIDNSSLIDGVSFSPSFNYQLLMANNNTVAIFDPVEYLEYGTTYLVTINQNVKDIEGNPLLQEDTFVFTVGDDFTKPVLISVRNSSSTNLWSESDINEYVEKDDTIVFVFSKQMNKNNIEAYISFSPSVEGSFTWNNDYQLSFTPNDIFDILEVYNVNISESLSDINGNELEQSYSFKFKINGTDSLPPEVIKISSPDSTNWQNNQFINIMTDGSNVFYTNIQIHFSHPMHQIKVINNLSVEYIGGSGSSGVQIIKYIWNSPSDTILRIDLNGLDSGNFYELKIKGEKDGATDKKNNYLLEDYIIYFKT
ncbi:MAG TPA: hypothetical protein ENI51_02940, partial [Candidatus Atribacteria bacterium]|nr:hypothetical protein [Candidatus Atribacteria bacterium]